MNLINIVLALVLFNILNIQSLVAQTSQQMQMSHYPPDPLLRAVVGSGSYIYLTGDIDPKAPERFKEFLEKHDPSYTSTVILNSLGGNPTAAMRLGQMIRDRGFSTDVGVEDIKNGVRSYIGGQCYSACSLVYLGGSFRWIHQDSKFGVHRFYFSQRMTQEADIAQILSAAITTYITKMGVDTNFYEISTRAGRDEMMILGRDQLIQLGVINNGYTMPKWSIEGTSGLLYLKGERDSVHGINKLIFLCDQPSGVQAHMIMDPQGRQSEAMALSAHSLMIDGKPSAITPRGKKIVNGWLNATYKLTAKQVHALLKAQSVGIIIQFSRDAPTFLGFNEMKIGDGCSKYENFLKNCRI